MAILTEYTWIFAISTVALVCSSFGNGANDVANSYATSVAARSLTMVQVGFLSAITEFLGAVALGSRVTSTIKNKIIDINRFKGKTGPFLLAMGCVEIASAVWLLVATKTGFTVSTTQTVVGAFIGVALASRTKVKTSWREGGVTRILVAWAVAPFASGVLAAILMVLLHHSVLVRSKGEKIAYKVMPIILSVTAAILALFMVVETPNKSKTLKQLGATKVSGIVFGVLFGTLLISGLFFYPYVDRRFRRGDRRIRARHVVLGPLLLKEDPPLFLPGSTMSSEPIQNYYMSGAVPAEKLSTTSDVELAERNANEEITNTRSNDTSPVQERQRQERLRLDMENPDQILPAPPLTPSSPSDSENSTRQGFEEPSKESQTLHRMHPPPGPRSRFLMPVANLPVYYPRRIWAYAKYILLQGVTRDCVTYRADQLSSIHAYTYQYSNEIENLFTYAQVFGAIIMSVAHGSNDVSNAVAPWVGSYTAWKTHKVSTETHTPIWILAVSGSLIGTGFWFFGYHIIRSMGNQVTFITPVRGFCIELGAAITVLTASSLGLPVSSTQCVTGAMVAVGLVNGTPKAVNWKQVGKIFSGWVITFPFAGFLAGCLMAMALNTPHF